MPFVVRAQSHIQSLVVASAKPAVKLAVAGNKRIHCAPEYPYPPVLEIEIPRQAGDQATHRINHQIAHGVDQTRLLHIHAERPIHEELEYLPCGTDRHTNAERDIGQGHRRGGEFVAFKQHEDEQEPHQPESDGGKAVKRDVPPPELVIKAERFAQKDRANDKQRRGQQKRPR